MAVRSDVAVEHRGTCYADRLSVGDKVGVHAGSGSACTVLCGGRLSHIFRRSPVENERLNIDVKRDRR